MAMGRLNRPAIMVYGGSIHSKWKGESLNIVSAFEALGKNLTRYRTFQKQSWRNVRQMYVFSYRSFRNEFTL
jgi:dihydroxyacid dehydratase/phosphogluconate dehydratase